MIYISDKAQKYFEKLLMQQEKHTQIRIFIKDMGTINAKCGICYHFPNQKCDSNDIIIKFNLFSIYLNKSIKPFITGTKIDLNSNSLGTQLILNSPNLHNSVNNFIQNKDKKNIFSLKKRIINILNVQINPKLAIHGGSVSLIELTQDLVAIIKFHGGCNGCAMSYYTIKKGIETTLKKFMPELSGVKDGTKHQHGTHSFY